jgi:hypothetical protein
MNLRKEDVSLIGGDFLTADFPSDKTWLTRYLGSEQLRRFAVYYLTFRELKVSLRGLCRLFIDHTGFKCSEQLLCLTAKKIRELEAAVAEAEKAKDFEALTNIKLKSYNFRRAKNI